MNRRARIVTKLREDALNERLRVAAFGDHSCMVIDLTPRCISCDAPAVDSGEGRFCGACSDYEGTCVNDHCLTCGAST